MTIETLNAMINELPQNRPLYMDSGLWQVRTDDMEEVIYQQQCSENFSQFIERVFNYENKKVQEHFNDIANGRD